VNRFELPPRVVVDPSHRQGEQEVSGRRAGCAATINAAVRMTRALPGGAALPGPPRVRGR
jgi:hypothetical protein